MVLGFSAGIQDLVDDGLIQVQPPEDPLIITSDTMDTSKSQAYYVDTKKWIRPQRPPRPLREILSKHGLAQQYAHVFDEHEIDMEAFALLKDDDLKEMSIVCSIHRRKILGSVAKVNEAGGKVH